MTLFRNIVEDDFEPQILVRQLICCEIPGEDPASALARWREEGNEIFEQEWFNDMGCRH
jgi:hypothetical protein